MMGTWFLGASILFTVIALWMLIDEQLSESSKRRSLNHGLRNLQDDVNSVKRNMPTRQSSLNDPVRAQVRELSEQLSALQDRLDAVEAKASRPVPAEVVARGESMRQPLRPEPTGPSPKQILVNALQTGVDTVDDFLRAMAVMEPAALDELISLSSAGRLDGKFAKLTWSHGVAGGQFEMIQMGKAQLLCFYREAADKQYFAVAPVLHEQRASMVSPIFGDSFVVNPKSAPVGAELKRVNAALIACFSRSDLTLNDLLLGIKRKDTDDLRRLKTLSSEELYQAGEVGV